MKPFSDIEIQMQSKDGEDYLRKKIWSWIDSSNLQINLQSRLSRLKISTTAGDIPIGYGYQKTGRFNVLYPGFIQLTSVITLGLTLQPSTYNGPQNDMLINLHQVTSQSQFSQICLRVPLSFHVMGREGLPFTAQ
ncbi:hypothetical protein CMV_022612 [Castanea mollissima]|uniref:Neprosin PEP catalytic domain-containing protein n=1 Tax=Castanea mollissima TaxID=60419 RepID=A0A8J4QHN9_9ROSI|nr:hypothetical protein CMV_022612 [Castanea mollissima]